VPGCARSSLSSQLLSYAPAWGWVLGARVLDRTGKGIRTAPRDALLRDSSDPDKTGATFGFHRFMDSAGASIGPLLALGLLTAGLSLRQVIVIAIVPGLLTMLVLRFIREVPEALAAPEAAASRGSMRALPGAFWSFTGAWTVFSLGN